MLSDYPKHESELALSIGESNRILSLLFYDIIKRYYLLESSPIALTENQISILRILKMAGPLLVSEVAKLMQITRAAASKNIEKLVGYNLVIRKVLSEDRRAVNVSLLKDGEKIVDKLESIRIKKQNAALTSMNSNEKKLLNELLTKFLKQCLANEKDIGLVCLECQGSMVSHCVMEEYDIICRFRQ